MHIVLVFLLTMRAYVNYSSLIVVITRRKLDTGKGTESILCALCALYDRTRF